MVTLVAALAAAVDGVGADGVRRAVVTSLEAAPVQQRAVQVTVRLDPERPEVQDLLVRSALDRALAGTGARAWRSDRGESLAVTAGARTLPPGGALLVPMIDAGISEHARLLAGRWPARLDTPASMRHSKAAAAVGLDVALQVDAASALGIRLGDRLSLMTPPPSNQMLPPVRVVGLWRAADSADPYWFADPLEMTGTQGSDVFGPVVFTPDITAAVHLVWQTRWTSAPDPYRVGATDALEPLAERVGGLQHALVNVPTGGGWPATVDGGLASLVHAQVLVVGHIRTASDELLALLAALGAACCFLVGGLLADLRTHELITLRARGMGTRARIGVILAETVVIAGLSCVLGAALALAVVRGVDPNGPGPDGHTALRAGFVALFAALVATLTSLLAADPLLRGGRDGQGSRTGRTSPPVAGGRRVRWLVVGVPGAVAGWQLRSSGASGVRLPSGGLDWVVLLAVPVLILVTGVATAVWLGSAVRVFSLLGRSRHALPALIGWQAARRGFRPITHAMVLVSAVAAATATWSAAATVRVQERQQAQVAIGTQFLVRAPEQPGAPDESESRSQVATAIMGSGATTVMPVYRAGAEVADSPVTVLAVDPGALVAATAPAGQARIAAPGAAALGAAQVPWTPLPAGDRLAVRIIIGPQAVRSSGSRPPGMSLSVSVWVSGRDGVPVQVRLGTAATDGLTHLLSATLPASARRLMGLQLTEIAPPTGYAELRTVVAVSMHTAGSASLVALPGWRVTSMRLGGEAPRIAPSSAGAVTAILQLGPQDGLGAMVRFVAGGRTSPLPAIVDRRLQAAVGSGDAVLLDFGDRTVPLSIVAVVDQIPGSDPDGLSGPGSATGAIGVGAGPGAGSGDSAAPPALMVDRASLAAAYLAEGFSIPEPNEWWVTSGPPHSPQSDPEALAASASRVLATGSVADRAAAGTTTAGSQNELMTAFLGQGAPLGLYRMLLLSTLASALIAGAAAGLGLVVAQNRRRSELAALCALGLSRTHLRLLLRAEQLIVVGLGAAVGILTGWALAWLIVPVLTGPLLPGPAVAAGLTPSWPAPEGSNGLAAVLTTVLTTVLIAAAFEGYWALRIVAAGRGSAELR